jgi:hypothetical protein
MGPTHPKPPSRQATRIAIASLALVLLVVFGLRFVLEPQRATGFLLARVGGAMGLEITASGSTEYRLRGTPTLVLHDVVAREPGAAAPLLRADRLFLSLPWSTLRARGAVLAAIRIELDAPVLDLHALQHWLATRPASERRLPTLAEGLRISDGRIHDDDWDIDGIQVELPLLAREAPLRARVRGRYIDPPLSIPVDLAVAIVRPAALVQSTSTGFAVAGRITVRHGSDWRLPATVTLSGPLAVGRDDLHIEPARFGAVATYEAGSTRLPFALGIHGPLRFDEAAWLLSPANVVLRGRDDPETELVPALDARGSIALGRSLVLRLQGGLAAWPQAWPALPEPLASSQSRLPFVFDYTGAPDLTGIAALQLRRDATRFDARFRLQDVQAWLAGGAANPLPPLDGSLHAPRLDIAGARLEGVEVRIDEPEIPDAAP